MALAANIFGLLPDAFLPADDIISVASRCRETTQAQRRRLIGRGGDQGHAKKECKAQGCKVPYGIDIGIGIHHVHSSLPALYPRTLLSNFQRINPTLAGILVFSMQKKKKRSAIASRGQSKSNGQNMRSKFTTLEQQSNSIRRLRCCSLWSKPIHICRIISFFGEKLNSAKIIIFEFSNYPMDFFSHFFLEFDFFVSLQLQYWQSAGIIDNNK